MHTSDAHCISNWTSHLAPAWSPCVVTLWLSAGQERFGNMTRVYYKEAVGAFIVFDVTRVSTFEAVQKWKHDIDSKVHLPNGDKVPVVLLANKVCAPLALPGLGMDLLVQHACSKQSHGSSFNIICALCPLLPAVRLGKRRAR